MTLTFKSEIMALKSPTYYQINEVLKKRKAEIPFSYRGEEALKISSSLFFAIASVIAIVLCAVGFSPPHFQYEKIFQITGCSLLSIVALGVPFVIFVHKKLERRTAPQEEIDAYLVRYDNMLKYRIKNNGAMTQFHRQKLKSAEDTRALLGLNDKVVQ